VIIQTLIKMKQIFIFAVMLVALTGYSQDGVYLTYQDYKNEKPIAADANSLQLFKNIIIKINGKELQYKYGEVFGILHNNKLYRFAGTKNVPANILTTGDFCIWRTTWADFIMSRDLDNMQNYYISKDIQSPLFYFTNFTSFQKLTEQHPEFKPLLDCLINKRDNEKSTRLKNQNLQQIYYWIQYCLDNHLPH
jgi:hypothetical protein